MPERGEKYGAAQFTTGTTTLITPGSNPVGLPPSSRALGMQKGARNHATDGERKAAEWSRTRGHEQPAAPSVDPEMGSDGGWQEGPKETSSHAELSHHLGIFLISRRKVRNSLL